MDHEYLLNLLNMINGYKKCQQLLTMLISLQFENYDNQKIKRKTIEIEIE